MGWWYPAVTLVTGGPPGALLGHNRAKRQALERAAPVTKDERPRRPWLLGSVIALICVGVVVALLTSEMSGTGAENVGDDGREPLAQTPPRTAQEPRRSDCVPTESNPGGTNNYIPDAPALDSLGQGFVITGQVRSAKGCRPLEDVRVQVWLATETGTEQDNREA